MEEAWEAGFNQEGPPSLLGDAKVRLLILPEVHACLRLRKGISLAFRPRVCRRIACMGAWSCISACGCKKRHGPVETRGGDLLFSSQKAGRLLEQQRD